MIDEVCKEAELEINNMNQNGFTAAGVEESFDDFEAPSNHDSNGQLIGDEKKVKTAMIEFK